MTQAYHDFGPVWSPESKILILGSFPSVKSRENGFYYAHKQNRFWKLLSQIYSEEIADDKSAKIDFLLRHYIALWDVIASCEITGSSDSSIKNVEINDINSLVKNSSIERIFVNGKLAYNVYEKYVYPITMLHAIYLPSTSPANASFGLEVLKAKWQIIKEQ